MKPPVEIETTILAVLEEAGEENVSALLNTVQENGGSTDEVYAFAAALSSLFNVGYVEFASSRDNSSRRWLPISKEEIRVLLSQLELLLRWSTNDRLWIWADPLRPRVQVLLTSSGLAAAREVLSNKGYPEATSRKSLKR